MPADLVLFRGMSLRTAFPPPRVRIFLVCMLAWVPLALLSLFQRQPTVHVEVPFLHSVVVHTRLLIALPLLLAGGRYCDSVLALVFDALVKNGIVRGPDRARLDEILTSTSRWANSPLVNVLTLVAVLVVGHQVWKGNLTPGVECWWGKRTDDALRLTYAGHWYAWVGVPLFQFVAWGWFLRLLFWWHLLFRVSRLDLYLVPIHPDRVGGLGFIEARLYAFWPFLAAQGALISGVLLNRIVHQHQGPRDFGADLALAAAFVLILVLGPLTSFTRQLILARRRGINEYNALAFRYTDAFKRRWMGGEAPATEEFLGSPDIQSLADLGNSYEFVRQMRPVPFGKSGLFKVLGVFALPIVPLVFAVIPAEELLRKLLQAIL